MNIELFKQRLIETAIWCQQHSKAEHRLRSPLLRPNFPQDLNAFHLSISNNEEENLRRMREGNVYLFEFKGDQEQIVEDVAKRRATLLQETNSIPLSSALGGGLFLTYNSGNTLYDGGAEQETGGFYDVGDTPPWDTWLGYVYDTAPVSRSPIGYLVSWIPNQYLAVAEEGLDWVGSNSLHRLGEVDTDFTRQLRAAGLLS